MNSTGDDCFYFFSSNCSKGDSCTFRHCDAARDSTMTCSFWRKNQCKAQGCPYRHAEMIQPIVQNKADQPCYFESAAGGCTRPKCQFQHTKPRTIIKPSVSNIITLVDATQEFTPEQPQPGALADYGELPPTQDELEMIPVIDPIIVNPADDSDFDSPYGSPVKGVQHKPVNSNIIDLSMRKDLTFTESVTNNGDSQPADATRPKSSGDTSKAVKSSQPIAKVKPENRKVVASGDAVTPVQPVKSVRSKTSSKNDEQVKRAATAGQQTKKVLSKKNSTNSRPSSMSQTKQGVRKSQVSPSGRAPQTKQGVRKSQVSPSGRAPQTKQGVRKSQVSPSGRTPQTKQGVRKSQVSPSGRTKTSAASRPKKPIVKTESTGMHVESTKHTQKDVIPAEPKVISLKKNVPVKEEETSSSDDNSDEDLGIKSLEQTLRERALRSMGIIELKSGRVVRTKDLEKQKERRRSSGEREKKSAGKERNASEKASVHKRIGTVRRTPPGRKRSVEERQSQARNKEREERIKRLKLEQEQERKRKEIIAAKRKARVEKAIKVAEKSKEREQKEESESSASEDEQKEDSDEESSPEEASGHEERSEDEKEEEEEDLDKDVDVEIGDADPDSSSSEEEEVPVKVVFDTRRAIRKSDSIKNFTIKKSVPVEPVKAKVVEELTIKKTIVVQPKVEKEKPKRKRRVIIEEDYAPVPEPVSTFSVRSHISKPKEVRKKAPDVEVKRTEVVVEKPKKARIEELIKSEPKAKILNVWSRRAWDSRLQEFQPKSGGIRSRLGIAGTLSGETPGVQETKEGDIMPGIRRRLGWRKTPVVNADEDTDSDPTSVKKAVSLAAIRARVGLDTAAGRDQEIISSVESVIKDVEVAGASVENVSKKQKVSGAAKKLRHPIQIYVPPQKKRATVPDDEESSVAKRRMLEEESKEQIKLVKAKEAKTFAQLMAEKREIQRKLIEEQKTMSTSSPWEGSPVKKPYTPIKFDIDEKDLADDSSVSKTFTRKRHEEPTSRVSVALSDTSKTSWPSSERTKVLSSRSGQTITSSISDTELLNPHQTSTRSPHRSSSSSMEYSAPSNVTFSEEPETLDAGTDASFINVTLDSPSTSLLSSTAPESTVQEVTSTSPTSGTGQVTPPSSRPDTGTSDLQLEEDYVSAAKRYQHEDSWLNIDIDDLDDDTGNEETNDDDLLREIDELLA